VSTIQTHPHKTFSSAAASSAILRDLSGALMQQMFFWGMDAASSHGNLFQKKGFRKTPSPGLQGTSCYSLPWQEGEIFLHGACVGWFSETTGQGFMFIRPSGKCFIWEDGAPPIPGDWPAEKLSPVNLSEDFPTYSPFISWLLDHEAWVNAEMGTPYRHNSYRKYKSLSKSRPWLSPDQVVSWLDLFLDNPSQTPRAKRFSQAQFT